MILNLLKPKSFPPDDHTHGPVTFEITPVKICNDICSNVVNGSAFFDIKHQLSTTEPWDTELRMVEQKFAMFAGAGRVAALDALWARSNAMSSSVWSCEESESGHGIYIGLYAVTMSWHNGNTYNHSQSTVKSKDQYKKSTDNKKYNRLGTNNWQLVIEKNPTYWVLEKYEFNKSFRCKLITFCKSLKIKYKIGNSVNVCRH